MRTLFTAIVLGGVALAQTPPPSSHASDANPVIRMSINDLKAIYDGAGVAYEVKSFGDGAPYLAAAPEGFVMFATLMDCADPATASDCASISLESGSWTRQVTAADLNHFNATYIPGKAFLTQKGQPALIYSFRLEPGVSGGYVRASLRSFINVMKYFGSWEWLPASGGPAPPPPEGAFGAGSAFDGRLEQIERPLADSQPAER